MTWVAWRQQRPQVLASLAVIAAVAGGVVFFRFDALSYMRDKGITGCLRVDEGRCESATMNAFSNEYTSYVSVIPLVLLCLPVLLGMFAGAPLFAREFEQGTHIFTLTQSVGRARWWATKSTIAGVPVVVGALVLGLITTWGLRPLSYVAHGRMVTPGFETQGLVLAAYTLVAFAVGATAGLLTRNTVVAMASTIGLYLVLLVGVSALARPHYLDPVENRGTVAEGAAIGSQSGRSLVPDDAWRVDSSYFDPSGREVSFDPSSCRSADNSIENCLTRQNVASLSARFHPDNQFWGFQLIESIVFLVIAAALLGTGVWVLLRRLL